MSQAPSVPASPSASATSRRVSPESLLEALRWRYACKQFDPERRIADADWRALEQALLLSPSSFGLQPWKFLVIENRALRERLVPVSWGQRQVVDASHFVVFAARRDFSMQDVDRHLQRIAAVRGVTPDSLAGYRQRIESSIAPGGPISDLDGWCARQAYLALGTFLTSAALLGIDACPMEGLEPQQYDAILDLPARGYRALCAAAAGYRAADDRYQHAAKVRFEPGDILERR